MWAMSLACLPALEDPNDLMGRRAKYHERHELDQADPVVAGWAYASHGTNGEIPYYVSNHVKDVL